MADHKNIPQGYKDSPLGVIPQEWEVKRLGEITTKVGSGVTPKGGESVYTSNGHYFIRSQNVGWGHLILDDVAFIDNLTHKNQISTELQCDDVLLNITGASIGRSTIVSETIIGGNVNQHVCIIRLKKDTLPFFVCSYLLSEVGQRLIDSYQAGGNRQGLNFEQIKSFLIPIPPIEEQERIAEVLGCWDKAIEGQTKMVALLETRKRALMQRLLTPKPHWQKTKLGETGKIITGNTPNMKLSEYYGGEHGWATAVDFTGKYIYNTATKLTKLGSEKARIVPVNSVLITCIASIGKNAITKITTGFNQQINGIVPSSNFDAEFIYYQIENSISKLKEVAGAGAVQIINKANFENIKLFFPPIPEQKSIAEKLSMADAEIDLAKSRLDLLRTQKRALMQQLLTGKKRMKI